MGDAIADVVIPVYNEGRNIRRVLDSLKVVRCPLRVLICYDFDEDDTIAELCGYDSTPLALTLVKSRGRGALQAVLSGLAASDAPFVITYPADDDYNGDRVETLIKLAQAGSDIVSASRFMPGGTMEGCPWLKAVLVRTGAFAMYHLLRVPTRDATNGLRLFSRRVVAQVPIESRYGFAYSVELLVKVHRLGWPISETPFLWRQRTSGSSRFRVLRWLPQYLTWVAYGAATTFLRRGPESVQLRPTSGPFATTRQSE
jgi:glycosyltransferase involved in cell wall biosynthesis